MHAAFAFLSEWFPQLDYKNGFALWVPLVLGSLAVAAVVALYIKEAGRIGVVPRVVMATVRIAIVVVVAYLLLGPVWMVKSTGVQHRPVAVLIDVSESMGSQDPRPNVLDQERAARAFGLIAPTEPFPVASLTSRVVPEELAKRPSRLDVARAAITHPKVNLLERLSKVGPLEVYTFGDRRASPSAVTPDWLKSLKADGTKTALSDAAMELLKRDATERPAAIVIITDGRENAGDSRLPDLARECAEKKVPVFVYGVGSSAFGRIEKPAFAPRALGDKYEKDDKKVDAAQIVAPRVVFVDDIATIPVRYTLKGVPDGSAKVVLKYGDRVVATEEYTFSLTPEEQKNGQGRFHLMKFIPTRQDAEAKKPGYSVTVTVTTGTGAAAETLVQSTGKAADIVSRKLRVLVVDSLPRYDFKYIQRALQRDRRVEAKFYLTEGDRAAMRGAPPFDPKQPFDPRYPWLSEFSRELNGTLSLDRDEFRKLLYEFDLLILGDVPAKYFTAEHQQTVKDFVAEGGGLIHIAGRWHAPAGWAAPAKGTKPNPIAEVLPVELEPVRFPIQALDNPAPFVPVLAPGAARTSVVSLADDPLDNAELWGKTGPAAGLPGEKQLKPMYWYYPVTKTKPAADVFLTHPTARTPAPDNKPMPLLAGHYFGKGYVLFVGFDDTWRWRFNTQEELSGRFWTQAIYTAGFPRIVGTKRTQITRDTPTPEFGKTTEVYVRVFDENYQPSQLLEIEGTLENVDAGINDKDRFLTVKFRKLPDADGEYVATIPNNKAGQFKLTVDPKNKSPATDTYTVPPAPNPERDPGEMDEKALKDLCDATAPPGKNHFYREETLWKLPGEVKPQSWTYSTSPPPEVLWNEWAMILLISLLALEWFLRKFNGLS